MYSYHYNDKDKIRRAYLLRKPTQPLGYAFPSRLIQGQYRKFTEDLFANEKYKDWLEYSMEKDIDYCLYSYLFIPDATDDDGFVVDGFRYWKKIERIRTHVRGMSNAHNQVKKKCEALMNENEQIVIVFAKYFGQYEGVYRRHLNTSVRVNRFLLRQGLAFHDHDKSEESNNRGNCNDANFRRHFWLDI